MWRGVIPVSMLRVNLTVTGEISIYLSFCKLLPENPTNHEDSRNSKEIQGVGRTLDFLASAWSVGFSGKSLVVLSA